MDWINLAQDRDLRRSSINTVINIRVPYKVEKFLSGWNNCWLLKANSASWSMYLSPLGPVTVAERLKACAVFACSEAGIVGSNSTQAMDVWCLCVCVCVRFSVFVYR
jgi:hypothetical protein